LNYEYDDELYQKTIFACALDKDIKNFTHGDLHHLSEKGSNLSGG
jgi:ABC-type bacteriocin/lantibiotic exporter with double-glycine peptidase domain